MKPGQVTTEMAARYFRLFVNRLAYTVQSHRPDSKGKHYYYRPRDARQLTRDAVREHLNGTITIGIYALNPKTQRSKWVAIDADYENALGDLLKLQWELGRDGVEAALEKSRRGAHLWGQHPAIPHHHHPLQSELRPQFVDLVSHRGRISRVPRIDAHRHRTAFAIGHHPIDDDGQALLVIAIVTKLRQRALTPLIETARHVIEHQPAFLQMTRGQLLLDALLSLS